MRTSPAAAAAVFPRVGVAATVFPARLVRGTPVIDVGRCLLIRRGTAPGIGRWCYPGGRLEAGEGIASGAAREVLEETGVSVVVPTALPGFCATDVLDADPVSGCLRFHYTLAHVLAYALVDGTGLPPPPIAASDADAARWVTLGAGERGAADEDSTDGLARLGLLVPLVADVSSLAVKQWAVRGFNIEERVR